MWPPATVKFRVDEANEGHVTLSVFVGRTLGSRGHSGRLVLRTDEFVELLADPIVTRILGADQLTLRGQVSFAIDDDQLDKIRTVANRRAET